MSSNISSNECRPKRDYQELHRLLKIRCEEISKDNDALSSRLINLKLLVYKAEKQCRKIQEKLDDYGVNYQAAATLAATLTCSEETEMSNEKSQTRVNRKRHLKSVGNSHSTFPSNNTTSANPSQDLLAGMSTSFDNGAIL